MANHKYINLLTMLANVFAFVALFALTRQSSLEILGSLLVPVTGLYIMVSLFRGVNHIKEKYLFYILNIIVSWGLFVSIFQNNIELSKCIREFLILNVINLSFLIKPNKFTLYSAYFFILIQIFILYALSSFSYFYPEFPVYYNKILLGKGSIYPFLGFWLVTLHGNALIPLLALIIGIEVIVNNGRKIYLIFISIATFLCGNVTYLFFILIFYLYLYLLKLNLKKFLFLLFLLFTLSPFLINYIGMRMFYKKQTDGIFLRMEQIKALTNDFVDSPQSIIFGNGLGNMICYEGKYRKYTGNNYFEFQCLYVLNQLGLYGFILYVFLNLLMAYKSLKFNNFLCYFFYCCLSSTNPYLFNLNHFWAIIILKNYDYYRNNIQLTLNDYNNSHKKSIVDKLFFPKKFKKNKGII